MYRMVVTDLDGTLLNNKKQVSEANVKAIQNLKDQILWLEFLIKIQNLKF